MSIAGLHNITSVTFTDQAGDGVVGIMRAPWGGATVKAAYAFPELTISASTANFYDLVLQNGGTTGTSTTAIGTAGGTAGVTAITQAAFTLNTSADELASDLLAPDDLGIEERQGPLEAGLVDLGREVDGVRERRGDLVVVDQGVPGHGPDHAALGAAIQEADVLVDGSHRNHHLDLFEGVADPADILVGEAVVRGP